MSGIFEVYSYGSIMLEDHKHSKFTCIDEEGHEIKSWIVEAIANEQIYY